MVCLYADWISLNWPSNFTRSKYTNTQNGNLITENSQPAHIVQNVLGAGLKNTLVCLNVNFSNFVSGWE